MSEPKFCNDCVWSKPDGDSKWNLRCHNNKVMSKDEWALANADHNGTDCRSERALKWYKFPACGRAGKQFESY